jgi:hypothetical protein
MMTSAFFERHSWKVLVGISIIIGIFGAGDILMGMNADPAIAESMTGMAWEELQATEPGAAHLIDRQVRLGGAQLATLSLLSIIICLVGYRQGERWAWYALWALPLWMVLVFVLFLTSDRQPDFPPPPPLISAPIFIVVSALALMLAYRKFFSKP